MNQTARLAVILRELETRKTKAEFMAAGWNERQAEYEARAIMERIAAMTPEQVHRELETYLEAAEAGKRLISIIESRKEKP